MTTPGTGGAPSSRYRGGRVLPVAWTLGGWQLTGGPDAWGCWWVGPEKVRGWRGVAEPRQAVTEWQAASGAWPGPAYRKQRTITLENVRTLCPTAGVRADLEQAWSSLFPDRDDADALPLWRVAENGVEQVRYVHLDGAVDPVPLGETWTSVDLQLVATDPRAFGRWQIGQAPRPTGGTGGVISTGTGIVSTGAGIAAGVAGQPNAATVSGGGAAPNPVVLELVGPLADVVVVDLAGGSRVRYGGAIPAGTSVFINCDRHPAYDVAGAAGPIPGRGALLGTNDARSAVTVTGAWPEIPAGQGRTFAVVLGDMGASALLRVHSRPAWD